MVVWIESIDVYILLSTVIILSLLKYCQTVTSSVVVHFREFILCCCDGTSSLVVLNLLSTLSRTSAASIKPGIFPAFCPPLVA